METCPEPLLDARGMPSPIPTARQSGIMREGRRYAFEVVFDYGDWDTPTKQPHPDASPCRTTGTLRP